MSTNHFPKRTSTSRSKSNTTTSSLQFYKEDKKRKKWKKLEHIKKRKRNQRNLLKTLKAPKMNWYNPSSKWINLRN